MNDSPYGRVVARLFSQNQFSIKLGLRRVAAVLQAVGSPHEAVPSVVVAGTNGKGTTAAALAVLMEASGLRTGLFTSPHLVDFAERFRVGLQIANREELTRILVPLIGSYGGGIAPDLNEQFPMPSSWRPVADDSPLTYFELCAVAAWCLFAEMQVDVCIMEVGLGGRLDAVNVVDPIATVITTVDFDHQHWLGDTIEEIAGEKAGTMRPGRPVVIGRQEHRGAEVALRQRATDLGALVKRPQPLDGSELVQVPAWMTPGLEHHLATAITAGGEVARALGHRFDPQVSALRHFRWPGRRDVLNYAETTWVLDAAHNLGGAASFAKWWTTTWGPADVGLVAAMSDKDVPAMAAILAPLARRWYAVSLMNDRAMGAEHVADAFAAQGVDATAIGSTNETVGLIRSRGESVLVVGSIYLLGEVLECLDVDDAFYGLVTGDLNEGAR